MHEVETADPSNQYGAIYLWGTIGLGIVPDRIRALAPDAPLDSWDLLFKPENARRIAPCGITMMDSATDVIPSVLHYLGRDPNSTDPADLGAVERTLMAIRPYIRSFASGGAVNALASGETCLALSYSGDVIQAAARAAEAKDGSRALRRAEGRRAALVRHAGDPGRRAASGRGARVHQLHPAAGRDRGRHQPGPLSERRSRQPPDGASGSAG